jgi:hypothetical protein
VAKTAEDIFTGLNEADQHTAQTLFLRLITTGKRTDDTRHRLARTDLLGSGVDTGSATAVIDAFTRKRLLTQDRDTVEITHEALLSAWPRLRTWIDDNRTGLAIGQNLIAAAAWDKDGRDPSGLYRGTRLAIARDWATGSASPGLDKETYEFLKASEQEANRLERRRRRTLVALSTLLALAVIAAGTAIYQATVAAQERALSLSRQLAAQSEILGEADIRLSRQLSVTAWHIAHTDEARLSMLKALLHPHRATLTGHTDQVWPVVFWSAPGILEATIPAN